VPFTVGAGQPTTAPRRSLRGWLFAAAVGLFIAVTWIALHQGTRPDPYQPAQLLSGDWWRYPVEQNAFHRLPTINDKINDVFSLSGSKEVWAVGDEGLILHSGDGGRSWERQVVGPATSAERELSHAPQSGGFSLVSVAQAMAPPSKEKHPTTVQSALPQVQRVEPARDIETQQLPSAARTAKSPRTRLPSRATGKGSTTEDTAPPRRDPSTADLQAIHFANARTGWAVGVNGTILATTDGGTTWREQTNPTRSGLASVHFADARTGWVVGSEGTILTTTDGGITWRAQTSPTSDVLWSVHFADARTGWAVGAHGTILATTDGGKTWRTQTSPTDSALWSVHFASTRAGWAVGGEGTILATADGGTTWTQQASQTRGPLNSVYFADARTGRVVGSGGTILATSDGGTTWRMQTSHTNANLESVHFVDTRRGWAVGWSGSILATIDGGTTWTRQTSNKLASVHFTDAHTGWVVGDNGTILATTDGGTTWTRQASPTDNFLNSVHFVDTHRGWAVGRPETILATTDGGTTWTVQPSHAYTYAFLTSVHFADAGIGWAVGWGGSILATTDGGTTWTRQVSPTRANLESVHFADARTGWAVSWDGSILATTDGGTTWTRQASQTRDPLESIYFADRRTGWAVGKNGTILATTDGGTTWMRQTSPTSAFLKSVHFVDLRRGWAVGENGTILATIDGGTNWTRQTSPTISNLSSVHFADARTGWTVGRGETILATTDGGETWIDPVVYGRAPAPWYYLSLIPVAGLLGLALRRPQPVAAGRRSVADVLVSDRPLEAGDPDPLEFGAVALGLSRFLRNENTEPPLTLAVTGEWGTGKSSLMNLLRADLAGYGFRPVWFNAWHHQTEEHLLASLLENIRTQAVPPWWRPDGVGFRLRLLWLRGWRHWLPILALLLVFAVSGGYLVRNGPTGLVEIPSRLMGLRHDLFGEGQVTKEGSLLAWLVSLLGLLFAGWRKLTAFRIDPARLLATVSGNFTIRDLRAQTGFRHRFAREFRDVTEALGTHQRMVILIDDLDRCRPENVLEVLEAVNFLVSSGDCFVVLGMARDRVERCVGLGFRDVAEELIEEDPEAGQPSLTKEETGKRRRAEFARQYLEKLINIEVPVPVPSVDQSRELLAPSKQAVTHGGGRWGPVWRRLDAASRTLVPILLVVAVLGGGFWWGLQPPGEKNAKTDHAVVEKGSSASTQVAPAGDARAPDASGPSHQPPADHEGVAHFTPGAPSPTPPIGRLAMVLGAMLAAGLWRLGSRGEVIVKDSPEFQSALRFWHPLLIAGRHTPRSIKRFLNRVRFYAMRQRPQETARRGWQHWLAWLRSETPPDPASTGTDGVGGTIDEEILVALSAIQHAHPNWLKSDLLWDDFLAFLDLQATHGDHSIPQEIADHLDDLRSWPPPAPFRELFHKLSAGIHV